MSLMQMSVSGAVMVVAVAAIRALALNRLPKRTFPALWGVVLARLLLPFSLPSPFSVYSLLGGMGALSGGPGVRMVRVPAAAPGQGALPGTAQGAAASPSLWHVVWLCGALACGLVFAAAYIKCRREFQTSLPVKNDFVETWLREHPLKRGLSVRQSDRFSTPLTYGICRPVILLPKSISGENPRILQYVLTHEYVHICRFDSAAKLLLMAAACIHWFNPLVWALYILANRDIELSCDEAVVRQFGEQVRADYARALIRMEETRSGLTPLCSNFSKNTTEERITAIMKTKKATVISCITACLVVLGTATAFATSAQPGTAEESKEALDKALNGIATYSESKETMMSYVNTEDGKTYYSLDGGETWEALTDEEFEQRYPTPKVEWWTYEEYKEWLEQEKETLQSLIGEKAWTGGKGWFTWTQEDVDETIALYEEILEEIKNGVKVSKSVDGDPDVMLSMGIGELEQTSDIGVGDSFIVDTFMIEKNINEG